MKETVSNFPPMHACRMRAAEPVFLLSDRIRFLEQYPLARRCLKPETAASSSSAASSLSATKPMASEPLPMTPAEVRAQQRRQAAVTRRQLLPVLFGGSSAGQTGPAGAGTDATTAGMLRKAAAQARLPSDQDTQEALRERASAGAGGVGDDQLAQASQLLNSLEQLFSAHSVAALSSSAAADGKHAATATATVAAGASAAAATPPSVNAHGKRIVRRSAQGVPLASQQTRAHLQQHIAPFGSPVPRVTDIDGSSTFSEAKQIL